MCMWLAIKSTYHSIRYELKMAVTESTFIISSQSSSHVKLPHKAMRVGLTFMCAIFYFQSYRDVML